MSREIAVRGNGQVAAADMSTRDVQIMELLHKALEKGTPVETMKELVALKERIEDRENRATFFRELAAFQEECPPITKTRKAEITTRSGSKYEYKFAPLEEIARVIRPLLTKHNLSYAFTAEQAAGASINVICVLRHIDGHEERAAFPVSTETSASMSGAQKNGAALTYGRRQSLIAVLGLTTADSDVDAQEPGEGAADDDELITKDQLADLSALLDEVQADKGRFLKYMQVQSLDKITKRRYPEAVRALEQKRQAGI